MRAPVRRHPSRHSPRSVDCFDPAGLLCWQRTTWVQSPARSKLILTITSELFAFIANRERSQPFLQPYWFCLEFFVLARTFWDFIRKRDYFSLGFVLAVVVLYLGFWYLIWRPRQLRRHFEQSKLSVPSTFEITDTHYFAKSSYGESRIIWEHFRKWRSDDRLLLLYDTDDTFVIVAAHAFASQADFQTFKEFIQTKFPKR